ncbi:hypothetical protein [Streptomyces sp. NBC_00385]|uniref:hypothetical protein n=1 Tax=Streptomyces sp. NBC_00385 TaxID=2975733 RepID=UPI002DD9F162|nr:hypothetical protein [Streptomyces sp. NBC_00385]WRZ05069.1 hypothetical protein OG959_17780 [Streptomyces sp. NBC_00385]
MKTSLIAAIDTAHAHTMAAPPAAGGAGGSIPISVLLIIVLSGIAWWMFKHGDKTKKLHLAPGFVCLGLGLSMSGTQIGTMVNQLFGTFAQMIAQFASNA